MSLVDLEQTILFRHAFRQFAPHVLTSSSSKIPSPWSSLNFSGLSSNGFFMNTNRRTFFMTLAASGSVLATSAHAQAKADEKDPQSVALGYVADATKTDTKKYPKYAAGQVCTNCALYQGKASDAWGGCPLFAGKQVAGKGWCSAWAKKG
jgi:hypothetical protein